MDMRLEKRRIKKLVVVFMVMMLTVMMMDLGEVPSSRAASDGGFAYTENDDGTATLTGYYGMDKDLVIPSTLGGLTVTHIADTMTLAFKLDSVVIPDSIISIGNHSFFRQNLSHVELPRSLESLGLRAFSSNPALERITVAAGNLKYKDIDGKGVYTLDGETLVQGTNSGIIAAGTRNIEQFAFEKMTLTDIVIPNGVESIGDYAFSDNKLIEVMLPSSVKEIGAAAFEVNLLMKVTLSASLERMKFGVFRDNPLEQIMIPAQNQIYKDIDGKGLYTIDGETLIQGTISGTIKAGTKTIENSAFSGLGLTEIILPNSLERIELHAFRNNSLEQIIIPDNVKFIGGYAFRGNNDLRDVTILGSPVFEGDTIFSKISGLELKGYSGTSAESYADRNEIDFVGDDKQIQVIFNPIGSEEEIGITSIEVRVENYDAEHGLQYIWSQESTVPEDNAAWITLTNGDTLDNPNQTEDWYLHVRAKGLLGNDVTRRSDSLKTVFAGGYGTEEHPYEIETAEQLDAVRNYLNKYFVLIKDIDLTDFLIDKEEGWVSIGNDIYAGPFKGEFDGNGYVITNLTINKDHGDQGLFSANEGVIVNVGLTIVDVSGGRDVGGLVGVNNASGIIENSYAAIAVNGNEDSGVIKGNRIGIFVGRNNGTIKNSYARGELIGEGGGVGILAGSNSGTIINAYARGNLDGTIASIVGGLVGDNSLAGTIVNSYTTGNISGVSSNVGALVGVNSSRVNNVSKSYWNNTVNFTGIGGNGITDGTTGLFADQMKTLLSFEAFEDSEDTWAILEGVDYPYLKHPAVLTLTEPEDIRTNLLQSAEVKISGEITNADPLKSFRLHAVLSKEENGEVARIAEAAFDERIVSGMFTDLELPEFIQARLSEDESDQYTLWIFATYAAQGTTAIPLDLTSESIVLPEAPELKSAIPGDEQITLTWNDVGGADGYNVYQYEGDLAPLDPNDWLKIEEEMTSTAVNVSSLTNGLAYIFSVTAVSDGVESEFSNPLSATPQAPPSDNAQLSMIYIDGEELDGFQREAIDYASITVPYQKNQVTVTAAVYDPGASYIVTSKGSVVLDGRLDLEVGTNGVEIVGTAANGDEQSSYTLTINRAGSVPEWLASGELSIEEITQTSMKLSWPVAVDEQGITGYRIDMNDGLGSHKLITVGSDVYEQLISDLVPNTTYTFTVTAFNAAGNESGGLSVDAITLPLPINNGNNHYDVQSSNTWLSELTLSAGELKPALSQNRTEYVVGVEYEVKSLSVTPMTNDVLARVAVKGIAVARGQVSPVIDLVEGKNEIVVLVTAENGTKQEYIITITRAHASHSLEPQEMCRQAAEAHRFIDVHGHWAASLIQQGVCEEIAIGYPDGTFKPDDSITRAEFTVMLANALAWEESGAVLTFTDQGQIGEWAKQAVAQAVQLGIISGYADGSVRPNVLITRAEMAMMIAQSLNVSIDANAVTLFTDDDDIPMWAKGAVETMRRLGIASGRGDNRFVPQATATRAEAVVMLLRMKDNLLRVDE